MSTQPLMIDDGCVVRKATRCWWCSRKLSTFASRPNEGVKVVDPLGNEHVVHKCCQSDAEAEFRQAKEWK